MQLAGRIKRISKEVPLAKNLWVLTSACPKNSYQRADIFELTEYLSCSILVMVAALRIYGECSYPSLSVLVCLAALAFSHLI